MGHVCNIFISVRIKIMKLILISDLTEKSKIKLTLYTPGFLYELKKRFMNEK